jgi:2-aminoethanethiol dioxygenase/cysteine oxidase family protein
MEIERRVILWKMPMAAAAFLAAIPEVLRGSGPLTWNEFTARTTAVAKELYSAAGYDEDAYICRIAAEAVGAPDVPPGSKMGRFGKLDPPVEFGPVYRGAPIMIIQWKLAPNAWLPPHNHPHFNVLSVGLEGEAVVTHYDVEGDAPPFDAAAAFTVRRTREMLIAPRRISTLTSSRDNVHTFRAGPKGARGIDINTPNGKDIGFSFLDIASKPQDGARGTYAARWIGQTPPVS